MSIPSRISSIPPYRESHNDPPPQFKALIIGINYRSRPDELKGPVNDAKDVKRTLEAVYRYREIDITLMTDEDENKDTKLWPSAGNILRAIDRLVDGATSGDVFAFYYAGHCGQHDNGEDQYIIACDKDIMGNTLRERLIGPLPMGSRLTVVLDACHSGAFLGLGHYLCQSCLPRQRAQSLSVPPTRRAELLRRNTEGVWQFQGLPSPPFLSLPRRRFKKAVMTTLAVIRLKNLMEKKSIGDEDDVVQPTPSTSAQRLVCGRCNRASEFTKAPNIIFLAACGKNQQTWEDTKKRGQGMTTKLLKILMEEPSIKLGDLEQQLKKRLFKLSFKRVLMATDAFRSLSALVSPKRKEKLEKMYKACGVFDFKGQDAQVGSLLPVGPDEPLLLLRAYREDDEG